MRVRPSSPVRPPTDLTTLGKMPCYPFHTQVCLDPWRCSGAGHFYRPVGTSRWWFLILLKGMGGGRIAQPPPVLFSHSSTPQPGEGDRVIFHKHYLTCFVGDKLFAKLCQRSKLGTALHMTIPRTADACLDRLWGPPAWLAQNTGTQQLSWLYLV